MSRSLPVAGFVRQRSASLSMVVLVLTAILALQASILYSVTFGPLDNLIPGLQGGWIPAGWIICRVILLGIASAAINILAGSH